MSLAAPPVSPARPVLDLATIVALTVALVYSAGWAYAERYFAHFQVGLLALEVPLEYYFIYGFWVLWQYWWLAAGYISLAVLVTWLKSYAVRQQRWLSVGIIPLLLAVFVLVYSLGGRMGSQHYRAQQETDFHTLPRVRVWLKPTPGEDAVMTDLAAALPQGCHRLLLQNRSTLFIFRSRRGASQASLAVVAVPAAEVRALRVLPQFNSCEE